METECRRASEKVRDHWRQKKQWLVGVVPLFLHRSTLLCRRDCSNLDGGKSRGTERYFYSHWTGKMQGENHNQFLDTKFPIKCKFGILKTFPMMPVLQLNYDFCAEPNPECEGLKRDMENSRLEVSKLQTPTFKQIMAKPCKGHCHFNLFTPKSRLLDHIAENG